MRRVVFAALIALHGLVHLMGVVDFWKIADLEEIAPPGASDSVVAVLGGLWLVAAIGFVVGAVALWRGVSWWRPLVLATAVLSFVLAGAVWSDAWFGMIVSAAIALAALPGRFVPTLDLDRVDRDEGVVARTHLIGQRPVTRRIAPRD